MKFLKLSILAIILTLGMAGVAQAETQDNQDIYEFCETTYGENSIKCMVWLTAVRQHQEQKSQTFRNIKTDDSDSESIDSSARYYYQSHPQEIEIPADPVYFVSGD